MNCEQFSPVFTKRHIRQWPHASLSVYYFGKPQALLKINILTFFIGYYPMGSRLAVDLFSSESEHVCCFSWLSQSRICSCGLFTTPVWILHTPSSTLRPETPKIQHIFESQPVCQKDKQNQKGKCKKDKFNIYLY